MKYFLLCALLLICQWSFAQTASLPQVSVKGNQFVTADGKTIRFRGLDAPDPDKLAREGRWNKTYFAAVKSWGANILRFAVHPSAWRRQGKENYIRLLDSGVY